jgi:SAM-dependent methyltransferase
MQEPPDYRPNWYATSFDSDYERIYRNTDDTAAKEVRGVVRYLELPGDDTQPDDVSILDLGCGWGRHSIPLATMGYRVTGVDLSETMLTRARSKAGEAGLAIVQADFVESDASKLVDGLQVRGIRLIRGDMRNLPFRHEFDVVLSLFTSFGYFPDPADNERVLQVAWEALKPGGRLMIDVNNLRQFVKRGLGESIVTIADDAGDAHEVQREETYDPDRNRRVVQYRFLDKDREPIYLECELYRPEELKEMLEGQGFTVNQPVWGNFDGMTYSVRAPRLIMLATKPT